MTFKLKMIFHFFFKVFKSFFIKIYLKSSLILLLVSIHFILEMTSIDKSKKIKTYSNREGSTMMKRDGRNFQYRENDLSGRYEEREEISKSKRSIYSSIAKQMVVKETMTNFIGEGKIKRQFIFD